MIYKNLVELTVFADNLIKYIESSSVKPKQEVFHAIVYLMYIEDIFDGSRGGFSDEDNFDLDWDERKKLNIQITQKMDYIRETIPKLIDAYGRAEFVESYKNRYADRSEYWIK